MHEIRALEGAGVLPKCSQKGSVAHDGTRHLICNVSSRFDSLAPAYLPQNCRSPSLGKCNTPLTRSDYMDLQSTQNNGPYTCCVGTMAIVVDTLEVQVQTFEAGSCKCHPGWMGEQCEIEMKCPPALLMHPLGPRLEYGRAWRFIPYPMSTCVHIHALLGTCVCVIIYIHMWREREEERERESGTQYTSRTYPTFAAT